jgi:hypothetical protein
LRPPMNIFLFVSKYVTSMVVWSRSRHATSRHVEWQVVGLSRNDYASAWVWVVSYRQWRRS